MKWFGAFLVVLAAYFCGRVISKEEGKKLQAVESLISLLKYMRRRMSAERLPLYLLFSSYNDSFLEETGFLENIRSCRTDIPKNWANALSLLPLEKEPERELIRFGHELGSLSLEEQLKRLDSCLSVLETEKASLSQTLASKQKTIKTVSLLFGLLTAILLI